MPFMLGVKLDNNLHNKGWTIVHDSQAKERVFKAELVEILELGEDKIGGEEFLQQIDGAEDFGGHRHAEAMVRQAEEIPEEWREYILVFTGTVWQTANGDRIIAGLRWHGDHWRLTFIWPKYNLGHEHRLIRVL
jgi:hypothetical protein